MKRPHILLVEDEIHIAQGLIFNLEQEGYRVTHVETGRAAVERLQEGGFALLVLDLMLPDMDGLEVCRSLRTLDRQLPVLILTARGDEGDRVMRETGSGAWRSVRTTT